MIGRVLRSLSGLGLALRTRLSSTGEQRHFKRILIPTAAGTSEIDHLTVSRFGLFVIELKDYSGWIFGEEHASEWTSVHFGRKYRFQNPLRQNFGHLKALEEYLDVDVSLMHPLVVFRGSFAFKTPVPPGVRLHEYRSFIKEKTRVLLTDAELDRVIPLLEGAKRQSGFWARRRHGRALHERYNNAICPKCGSALVERVAKSGRHVGEPFLGCSGYPECRYLRRH